MTQLVIDPKLSVHSARMLAAVQLKTLRSLTVEMDLCHAWFLQGCTQLKALTLYLSSVKGASALAHLTELTQLMLCPALQSVKAFPAAEQRELGSTLTTLSNLQSLHLNHAPPVPVTQALSQLTGLTELTLYQYGTQPRSSLAVSGLPAAITSQSNIWPSLMLQGWSIWMSTSWH
jgi:hypothetical protein